MEALTLSPVAPPTAARQRLVPDLLSRPDGSTVPRAEVALVPRVAGSVPAYVRGCGKDTWLFAWQDSQGDMQHNAVRARCKSWRCDCCRWWKSASLFKRCTAFFGLEDASGKKVVSIDYALTYTIDAKRELAMGRSPEAVEVAFGQRVQRLVRLARRDFGSWESFATLEWQANGWPHAHALLRDGPIFVGEDGTLLGISDASLAKSAGYYRDGTPKVLTPRQATNRRKKFEQVRDDLLRYWLREHQFSDAGPFEQLQARVRRWLATHETVTLPAKPGKDGQEVPGWVAINCAMLRYWIGVHSQECELGAMSHVSHIYNADGAASYVLSDVSKSYQIRPDYSKGFRRVRASKHFWDGEKTREKPKVLLWERLRTEGAEDNRLERVLARIVAAGGELGDQIDKMVYDGSGQPTGMSLEASRYTPAAGSRYDLVAQDERRRATGVSPEIVQRARESEVALVRAAGYAGAIPDGWRLGDVAYEPPSAAPKARAAPTPSAPRGVRKAGSIFDRIHLVLSAP